MKKFILFMMLLCYVTVTSWGQGTCATAVTLTPGTEQCGDSAGQPGDFPGDATAPTNPCNGNYNDDEYWFTYTPAGSGTTLEINVDSITQTWAGVFVLDSCPSGSPACVASAVNTGNTNPLNVATPALTMGQTYYIVISNYGAPNNTAFCMNTTISVPPPPPGCGNNVTPADMATDVSVVPLYTFSIPPDATGFTWLNGTTSGSLDTLLSTSATGGDTVGYFLNFLQPNTTYFWTVIPYNASGDAGSCSEFRYTTQDVPPAVSGASCSSGNLGAFFQEGFGSTTPTGWYGDIGNGTSEMWDVIQSGGTGTGSTGPDGPHFGSNYAYFEADVNGAINDTAKLFSPAIDLSASTDNVELEFYTHMYGGRMGTLSVAATSDTSGGGTWTNIGSLSQAYQGSSDAAWLPVRYNLSTTYNGGNLYLRFTASKVASTDILSDMAIDEVTIKTCQACPAPSSGMASNETGVGADLSWTDNAFAGLFLIEIDTAGFTPDGAGVIQTSDNPYTWVGGLPITDYEFYVRSLCNEGVDTSDMAGPYAFTTLCAPLTPDYFENFTTFLPGCWDNIDDPADGGGSWVQDDWLNDTGSPNGKAAAINLYDLERDTLISPEFDLNGGPFQAEYLVALMPWNGNTASTFGSDDSMDFLITNDGGSSWTSLKNYAAGTEPTLGQAEVIDLTAYAGDTVKFAFAASGGVTNDAADNDLMVDNFRVRIPPMCLEPTALTMSNITIDGGTASWTAGDVETDWVLSYGAIGFTPGSGTQVATTADSTVLTGLSGGYDVYVRALCPPDSSVWTGPTTFFTLPPNADCIDAIAVACGDTVIASTSSAPSSANAFCGTTPGEFGLWYEFTGTGELITVSTSNPGTNYDTKINVYGTSCGALTCVTGDDDGGAGTTSIAEFIGDLGEPYYIFVNGFLDNSGTFEMSVSCAPCFAPFGASADDVTSTSANVNWGAPVAATAFVVEYGPDGFIQGSGTSITTGPMGGPIPISGLTSATDYDFFVSQTCGGMTDTVGPVSFTTLCAVLTPYYLDSFNTFLPSCWNVAEAGTPATGPSSFGVSDWFGNDFGNAAGPNGQSAVINAFVTHSDWLLSPEFDLSAGGHTLTFDVAAVEYYSTDTAVWPVTDTMFLLVSEAGGPWTSLQTWDSTSFPSPVGDSITIDLAAYTNASTQFAFYYTTGGIDSPEDIEVFVDQFEILVGGGPCGPLTVNGVASGLYQGTTIMSDAMIPSPNMVMFKAANSIDLLNNFEVNLGATFDATIVPCP